MRSHTFTDSILKSFEEARIVCLLFYGSSAYKNDNHTGNSDFDYCLLLKSRQPDDHILLRELCLAHPSVDLTVHYLDILESQGWSKFRHGNHGVFFLFHLASSKTVIGTNVFARKVVHLDSRAVKESLEAQIVEYFWRLDNWFFNIDSKELIIKFRKYLTRVAQDILAMKGDISYFEINGFNKSKFHEVYIVDKPYFSKRTKQLFELLPTTGSIEVISELREKLEYDFRKISTQ